jgi:DNA-binding NtrC family response regulator
VSEDLLARLRALLEELESAPGEAREDAAELLRAWAERAVAAPAPAAADLPSRFGMIGASPAMEEVFGVLAKIVKTQVTVLVLGESGTGKELVARALHSHGPRKRKPFLAVNCAAISPQLLESELFGHTKGSFTGAHKSRKGYAETADGGTLFLDEIGEMSFDLQAKLLRFLQDGEVRAVGGNATKKVDVRVVAATNRDLLQCVRDGRFREDLYYRLAVITVGMPPLRDRREDIPHLARFVLARNAEEGLPSAEIDDAALARLSERDWPGNIRELQNELTRAAAFARGGRITPADLG